MTKTRVEPAKGQSVKAAILFEDGTMVFYDGILVGYDEHKREYQRTSPWDEHGPEFIPSHAEETHYVAIRARAKEFRDVADAAAQEINRATE